MAAKSPALEIAGPEVKNGVHIIAPTVIQPGGIGWITAGNGSVNNTSITTFDPFNADATAAATGTGFHAVTVSVTPSLVMNGTNGGVVSFKIPIERI